MTIAIAMFSNDGDLVIGADSEETGGELKHSVDKFSIGATGNGSSLIIAGAGPSCHVDAIAENLQDDFGRNPTYKDEEAIKKRFRKRLETYYLKHVLCWPSEDERATDDFALIIGISLAASNTKRAFSPKLWITQQNTLRSVFPDVAIGAGRTYASAQLKEHRGCYSNIQAALAAIHILQNVKRDVRFCGKETHLWRLTAKITTPVAESVIKEAETLFMRYKILSNRQFFNVVKTEGSEHDKGYDDDLQRHWAGLRRDLRDVAKKMESANVLW